MAFLAQPKTTSYDPATSVTGIRFQKLGKLYHFDYSEFPDLVTGDFVIVETVRGRQMGQVMGFAEREDNKRNYKPILRVATPRDMLLSQQWKSKELQALIDCREAAAKVGGYRDVKFIKAEYTFDGAALTIMVTTEEDFNPGPLRNALKKNFKTRVDFQQIGPRDVARIMGGQGACGGPRCCSTFLTEFSPISIKMAKAQGIPLNPTEITGMCGRLRCCLVYEYELYVEARRQLPRRNKIVGTPFGEGRVIDVYPLRDGVAIDVEGQRQFVAREDIIPLDEFRALQEKAAEGCTKNESGACDCGARRPKSAQQDIKAAIELAHGSPSVDIPSTADSSGEKQEQKPKKRRSRRRRGKQQARQTDKIESKSTKKKRRRRPRKPKGDK